MINWVENDQTYFAHWRSESKMPTPTNVVVVDDTLKADSAFRLASEGTALLWRGDFQNAKQLLHAVARRVDQSFQKKRKVTQDGSVKTMGDVFNSYRQMQSQRARTLGMLLIPLTSEYRVPLARAPDIRQACIAAYGAFDNAVLKSPNGLALDDTALLLSLREIQGVIGAYEWRKKGIEIDFLNDRIHPHYGVFAPIRSEYIELVANSPLPETEDAFDIGTGTGVIAAVLARRGVRYVTATDIDERALICARENISSLGYSAQVIVEQADLYPPKKAGLIVCNPPWLPARPSSPLEHAVYDPNSRMLRGFLEGLSTHLKPNGEGWLILSDLAEHLELRSRNMLHTMFEIAGLHVVGRHDVRPNHPRSKDDSDPLHKARASEITSLWRLCTK
jgi:SAM-dependent methyltransferase